MSEQARIYEHSSLIVIVGYFQIKILLVRSEWLTVVYLRLPCFVLESDWSVLKSERFDLEIYHTPVGYRIEI